MASNTTLNTGSGGDAIATKQISLDGDNAKVQVVETRALSGSEDAYTAHPVYHAEDSAHTSGDYGQMALTVRSDTAAATATTDGDYQPLVTDANGRLHVIEPSAASAAASLAALDNIVLAEDAAHASGDPGVQTLTVRRNTAAATSGTDGDYQPLITDTNGRLHVLDGNSTAIAASLATIDDLVLLEDAAHSTGAPGIMALTVRQNTATALSGADGDYQPLITDTNGRVHALEANSANILTAVQLIDNIVLSEDAAHSSGDPGVMALGVRRDANTTMASADGDYTPLQVDANGNLKVNIIAGAGAGGTSSTDDAAFTAAVGSGTPIMGFATSDTVNSGDVGVVRMTVQRDMCVVIKDASGNDISPQVDDAAFTAATSLVSVVAGVATSDSVDSGDAGALRMTTTRHLMIEEQGTHNIVDDAAYTAGTNRVTMMGGFATTDTVNSGDGGALAMTTARALHSVIKTDTAGGTSIYRSLDLDESEEEIKASAGNVYWIHAVNLTADPLYLKFYNATAASVTVGTTTPVLTFPVPSQGTTDGAGFVLQIPMGISFSTAITMAATTALADADTGAPGANALVVNVGYA